MVMLKIYLNLGLTNINLLVITNIIHVVNLIKRSMTYSLKTKTFLAWLARKCRCVRYCLHTMFACCCLTYSKPVVTQQIIVRPLHTQHSLTKGKQLLCEHTLLRKVRYYRPVTPCHWMQNGMCALVYASHFNVFRNIRNLL